jgi:hypothetical protein
MVVVSIELDEADAAVRVLRGDTNGARTLLAGIIERAAARGATLGAERHRRRLADLG